MEANVKITLSQKLGEGPLWNTEEGKVYWTDILNGCLYRSNEQGDNLEMRLFPFHIGSFAFTKGNRLLLATNEGLFTYSFDSHVYRKISENLELIPSIRCNDGKVDEEGQFWFGTMQYEPSAEVGAIYRLTTEPKLIKEKEQFIIANGMAWHEDKMYAVDSGRREVFQIPFKNGRYDWNMCKVIFYSDDEEITPDGMTIDIEGNLWIALWGGGKVIQYNPETQTILSEVSVPVPYVTSCAFVGEHLSTLWITTAISDLNEEQLKKYPLAGSIFAADVSVCGKKNNVYQGDC